MKLYEKYNFFKYNSRSIYLNDISTELIRHYDLRLFLNNLIQTIPESKIHRFFKFTIALQITILGNLKQKE